MIDQDDLPKSRNVGRYEATDYWVTAGSWDTGYGDRYEIGIRRKVSGAFELIQANWNERAVKLAARAIVLMLNDYMSPSEIRLVISP